MPVNVLTKVLHATMQTQQQVQGGFLLDVVTRQQLAILEFLS